MLRAQGRGTGEVAKTCGYKPDWGVASRMARLFFLRQNRSMRSNMPSSTVSHPSTRCCDLSWILVDRHQAKGERFWFQSWRRNFVRPCLTTTLTLSMMRFSDALDPHLLATTHIKQLTGSPDSKGCHHFKNNAQSRPCYPQRDFFRSNAILQLHFLESPS